MPLRPLQMPPRQLPQRQMPSRQMPTWGQPAWGVPTLPVVPPPPPPPQSGPFIPQQAGAPIWIPQAWPGAPPGAPPGGPPIAPAPPQGGALFPDHAPPPPNLGVRPGAPAPGGGPGLSAGLPDRPPSVPTLNNDPIPGEVRFNVSEVGGRMKMFADPSMPKHGVIVVMIGTPVIQRDAHTRPRKGLAPQQVDTLVVKANAIVAWVDRRGFPGIDLYGGIRQALGPGAAAKENGAKAGARQADLGKTASVVPRFLRAIYAEGAVELRYGRNRFTASRLFLDPHSYRGSLVKPRLDVHIRGIEAGGVQGVPGVVRAERGDLVGRGHAVFRNAEVSTSRSDDRVVLQMRELTVQEFDEQLDASGRERPHFVGFHADTTQRFAARDITVRGERLPLVRMQQAQFGLGDVADTLPTGIRGARAGNQAHLGRFGFVQFGGSLAPQGTGLMDWIVGVGGYTKRGPALRPRLKWDHSKTRRFGRSKGQVDGFAVWDFADVDRNGREPQEFRHRIALENRSYLSDDLIFDVEYNEFSDGSVNNEYFERDDLEHKDRESYLRMLWRPKRPGTAVGTLTYRWHQRGFVDETTEEPVAGLWLQSLPLVRPRGRGALGVDFTSHSSAGRYRRQFAKGVPDVDYEAWRFSSDSRVHAAADLSDVRLTAYGGVSVDHYAGAQHLSYAELTRSALIYGANAHLQLHRTQKHLRGTPFELDGLRHIVDVSAGVAGRTGDDTEPADIGFFDRRELERDHEAYYLRLQNRWQTRRPGGGTRDLLDVEGTVKLWRDERGPYLRDSPGVFELGLRGEPWPRFTFLGDGEIDLDRGLEHSFLSGTYETQLMGKPWRISAGHRFVRGITQALTVESSWEFSRRYHMEVLHHLDLGDGQDLHRVLFRRRSMDHSMVFGVQLREGDIDFEFAIRAAIGGQGRGHHAIFEDRIQQRLPTSPR